MKNKAKKGKENRGITLIALVITIIILLILASVTIAAISGNNGILTNAAKAKVETRAATIEERINLWKTEKVADEYLEENQAQSSEQLLDSLEEEGLITEEEKTQLKENGHIVIGDKDISISEGLTEKSYTITNSKDEVIFNKIITEGDIAIEKPGFENYKIEGISDNKEGEFKDTGSINGKSGNLEIVGNINDATFKYNLTNFMQGDETFYCRIDIDGEKHYKEIKVKQGDIVTYEEDFAGITYDGNWLDEENENFTNGKAKYTEVIGSNVNMQIYGTGVDFRTVKGENIGRFFTTVQEINQDNSLGKIILVNQLSFNYENTEYVNFKDLRGDIIHFDKNDYSKQKKVQISMSKMKSNSEEQDGDTKIYIDAIYVYK